MSDTSNEKTQTPLSVRSQAILALVQGLLPTLTAIIGGLWIVYTYLNDQRVVQAETERRARQELVARLMEARQPFNKRQLDMYIETSGVVGRMVVGNESTEAWHNDYARFEQLYWTDLSMVEDDHVKAAMQDLYPILSAARAGRLGDFTKSDELRQASYRLARALNGSIEDTWKVNLNLEPSPPQSPAVSAVHPEQQYQRHPWHFP
jgi:hypothetical protein